LKFPHAPKNYWLSIDNQRTFVFNLGRKFGVQGAGDIENLENFYKLTPRVIHENGGAGLLAVYENDLAKLLAAVCPEYDWKPFKFARGSKLMQDAQNMVAVVSEMEKGLGIKDPMDWYRVTRNQLSSAGVPTVLKNRSALLTALTAKYPQITFDPEVFLNKGFLFRPLFSFTFFISHCFIPRIPQGKSALFVSPLAADFPRGRADPGELRSPLAQVRGYGSADTARRFPPFLQSRL